MRSRREFRAALWLTLGSPLALFILVALIALASSTSPSEILNSLENRDVQSAIWLSLKTTAISLVLIATFGLFLAAGMAISRKVLSDFVESLVTLPAILPPSVAGLALLMAFGRQGLLGGSLLELGMSIPFTATAVILAQVFVSCPFFVREAAAAFRSVDSSLIEAARLDGAGTYSLARHIAWPMTSPFLISGLILAWARAMGEFGATILFAGNLKGVTQTIPLAIYLGFESDLGQAKTLAIILMLIAVLVLAATRLVLGRQMAFAR